MAQGITQMFDYGMDVLTNFMGGQWAFHMMVFFVNLMLAIPNIVAYFILDANTHVIFWMGLGPTYVNLLVPAMLLCVSMCLPVLNCISMKGHRVKNVVFTFFIFAGGVLVCGGIYVLKECYEVSGELLSTCGTSPLTSKIDSEWQRLGAFHDACAQQLGTQDVFVDACPGFAEVRKGHEFYVDYAEQLEQDYGCQGFCRDRQPLFVDSESFEKISCNVAIGSEVHRVAYLVGIPTVCTGVIIFFFGQCLSHYDHI
eukprot:TRINITY_DN54363_c0_g1_i1.p2 TRINITY_DN54363_c0_g1~~TRINITY_DN54363_c0_g1_i1.p2  ORF type:complete len:255 (+),score=56.18 TRINITY_DN54363_c0_g1_i1:182-946(+)